MYCPLYLVIAIIPILVFSVLIRCTYKAQITPHYLSIKEKHNPLFPSNECFRKENYLCLTLFTKYDILSHIGRINTTFDEKSGIFLETPRNTKNIPSPQVICVPISHKHQCPSTKTYLQNLCERKRSRHSPTKTYGSKEKEILSRSTLHRVCDTSQHISRATL